MMITIFLRPGLSQKFVNFAVFFVKMSLFCVLVILKIKTILTLLVFYEVYQKQTFLMCYAVVTVPTLNDMCLNVKRNQSIVSHGLLSY